MVYTKIKLFIFVIFISGTVPTEIAALNKLADLNIAENYFNGRVQSEYLNN